jgi:hypothetical protein
MNSAGIMIDGDKIPKNTNSTTLLGLDIDSKLCFNEHIDKICKKLSKHIGILRKVGSYLPLKQRVLYYNAGDRSIQFQRDFRAFGLEKIFI